MVIDVKQSLSSLYRYFNVPKEFSAQLSSMKLPHLNSENLPGWTALALSRKYAKKLAGHNVEDAAFVRQWVEYAVTQGVHADDSTSSSQVLKEVNKALADQSYIAANYLTVADLFLFYVLHPIVVSSSFISVLCKYKKFTHPVNKKSCRSCSSTCWPGPFICIPCFLKSFWKTSHNSICTK
ncbi:unnamed protein product, partial [Bemisia tabaci]